LYVNALTSLSGVQIVLYIVLYIDIHIVLLTVSQIRSAFSAFQVQEKGKDLRRWRDEERGTERINERKGGGR